MPIHCPICGRGFQARQASSPRGVPHTCPHGKACPVVQFRNQPGGLRLSGPMDTCTRCARASRHAEIRALHAVMTSQAGYSIDLFGDDVLGIRATEEGYEVSWQAHNDSGTREFNNPLRAVVLFVRLRHRLTFGLDHEAEQLAYENFVHGH